MNWRTLIVVLLVILSGCTVVDQPGHSNTLSFSGNFNSSGEVFIMDGELYQVGTDMQTLNNVSVCGYTETGELLFAEPVPSFKVNQEITVRNNRHPHYIVLYSNEFWEPDTLWPFSGGKLDAVDYWVSLEDAGYRSRWARSEDELPVDTDRPLENGCPA